MAQDTVRADFLCQINRLGTYFRSSRSSIQGDMTMSNKTKRVTEEQISSQWVWLPELVDDVAQASNLTVKDVQELLRAYAVFTVRPMILERSGSYTVYRDSARHDSIEDLISILLGESRDHHTESTIAAAHYSTVGFSLPALHKWLEVRKLDFRVPEWNEWMRTTFQVLKDRELLELDSTIDYCDRVATSNGRMVGFEELQALSGYKTPADIRAWLTSSDIKYKTGVRGRPFTTASAVNAAMGVEVPDATIPEKRDIIV